MDKHAMALLKTAESWGWPILHFQESGETSPGRKFNTVMPKLLSGLLAQSHVLGGTLVHQFWRILGECHPRLKNNVEKLKRMATATLPGDHTSTLLFEGIDPISIDFRPVYKLAEELFTHIVMNPRGRESCESGDDTPLSASDFVEMSTETLTELAADEGNQKQEVLQALTLRRDGESCLLTSFPFSTIPKNGVEAVLAHVIPSSIRDKPETMEYIAMFAGSATVEAIRKESNGLGNVINLQGDAHSAHDKLAWGIEALEDNGKVKYLYRRLDGIDKPGPVPILLQDGEEIIFGSGTESTQLGSGPNAILCNLRLAVARVLNMSGAVEVISQWIEDGDDGDFPHVYIASSDFCNVLAAKLLVSGRALMM